MQNRLCSRIVEKPLSLQTVRRVAGCDVAISGDELVAAVVLLDAGTRETLEVATGRCRTSFPYVPGLLSFREIPVLAAAFESLRQRPDVVLCDGQGRAHPRRFGLACHLGLLLNLPSVGVAKSRLVGEAKEPGQRRGSSTSIHHEGEVVGRLLRTRDRVKPLYISVGHKLTLEDAVALVLMMGEGFRLPEPTRQADKLVSMLARGQTPPAGGSMR